MSEANTTSTDTGVEAYDAAKTSRARSNFLVFPTNSRRELTPFTRREIIKKSRALEANFAPATRIKNKIARQSVGSGIHFKCLSEDEPFNDGLRRLVEEWWSNPNVYSIDGSVDGWESKRIAVETIVGDGEYNAVFANHPESGFPCVQPLDVFEIETPQYGMLDRTFNPAEWDDGVRINDFERPIEFAVRSLPKLLGPWNSDYRFIPADSMVHIHRRRRARGHRGMPWGYSGINQGIDALDLNALVTGTAKLHSALAVAVKGTGRRRKRGAIDKIRNGDGSTTNEADTAAVEKVFGGGMINYLGEQGELSLLYSQHPGANVMAFWEMLLHQYANGYDLPFTVMWNMADAGGTAARYDAEDAQGTFDQLTDMASWRLVRREIIWFGSRMIKDGRLAAPKDPWWFSKLVFRGPRKITVDIGRMATSFKVLTRNAGMSIPRWFDEQGLEGIDEMSESIRFLGKVKKMCDAEGIDFSLVMEPTPGSQTNIQVQQPDA